MKMKTVLIIACAAFVFVMNGVASAKLTATANHDHIKIDFFYHGSSVSVRGVSDPGTDLIIKIASPDGHQALRQKGKVAGLLWMNLGELKFEHVPTMYSLHCSKKITDILDPAEREKYSIGYEAMGKKTTIQPVANDSEKTKWFNEFVKFQEDSKLYSESTGDILLTANGKEQDYYVLTP